MPRTRTGSTETIPTKTELPANQQSVQQTGSSSRSAGLTKVLPCARLEALQMLALALLREAAALSEPSPQIDGPGFNLADEVRRFEAHMIRIALVQTEGRQRRAARLLGMKITTLHNKIKHYKISIEEIQNEVAAYAERIKRD